MEKKCWFFVLSLAFVLLATTGCGGAEQEYTLVCDIDTEQFSFMINGEEGPLTTQTHGESRSSDYKDGKMVSLSMDINRTMTFEDTGNSYDLVGEISIDFSKELVNYEITVTGDTFAEPQTCVQ